MLATTDYPCYLVTLAATTDCWNRQCARQLARELGLSWGQYAVIPVNETDEEADSERVAAAKRMLSARACFEAALATVESATVRAWARSSWNRPILVKLADRVLAKHPNDAVSCVATLILANAIGL